MATTITFKRPDGKNIEGYLAEPEHAAGAPAIVVIQEWWGVNEQIRGVADRLGSAGYIALVPDLSTVIDSGSPRRSARRSSTAATRRPVIEANDLEEARRHWRRIKQGRSRGARAKPAGEAPTADQTRLLNTPAARRAPWSGGQTSAHDTQLQ
jgi:dienelactone hydrolase